MPLLHLLHLISQFVEERRAERGGLGGNLNRSAQRASVLSGSERWVNKKGRGGGKKSKRGSSGDQEALPPVGL